MGKVEETTLGREERRIDRQTIRKSDKRRKERENEREKLIPKKPSSRKTKKGKGEREKKDVLFNQFILPLI